MIVKFSRTARAESTRQTLLRQARKLFTAKGYAEASTDELVQRAKVTKGALYHHFANKQELYRAVVEEMEREVVARIDTAAAACTEPGGKLRAACHAYLDACLDTSLARILVIEAPVVLGWKTWCDIAQEYEVAALAMLLAGSTAAGVVHDQSVETMAQVLLGALNTAARVVSTAADPATARAQVIATVERLLSGFGLPDVRA